MKTGEAAIASPQELKPDRDFENSLRPTRFDEYIGQPRIKEKLSVFIEAAKGRKESMDHCLFCGPPGLGKTSLAYIIARELHVGLQTTSGPVIERPGDLAAILTNLEDRSVLFIDEIHRLSPTVEEILYPAMEDFKLDLVIGQGPSAKSVKIDLPRFTLVGATTRTGLLTSPLRDRFGISLRLEFYSVDELAQIITRSAGILKIAIDTDGAKEMARRARGTPRIANRLLRRVRDFAEVRAAGKITKTVAAEGLTLLEIDDKGFDTMDRKLLLAIIDKFEGGPVGVETLSSAISETVDTIEDVYEPFLLQGGYIARTPRGRVATAAAFEHLGRKIKEVKGQAKLPL